MAKKAKSQDRILVRAKKVGTYNSRRRYPAGFAHKDAGQPFYLIPRGDLAPKDQIGSWMEVVDEDGLKIEAQEAAAKAKEEELEIEQERDQAGVAAPPGPGDEGKVTLSPDASQPADDRASDQEVL